jgi:hypothetical protein
MVPDLSGGASFSSSASLRRVSFIVHATSGGRSVDFARQIVSTMPTTPMTVTEIHGATVPLSFPPTAAARPPYSTT